MNLTRLSAVRGNGIPGIEGCTRRPGEMGCIMSHAEIWKSHCESPGNPQDLLGVFEDDVKVLPGYTQSVADIVSGASDACGPHGLDFLYLNRTLWTDVTRSERYATDRATFATSPSYGTHAYLISKKSACSLFDVGQDACTLDPLDVYLASHWKSENETGSGCALAVRPSEYPVQLNEKYQGYESDTAG